MEGQSGDVVTTYPAEAKKNIDVLAQWPRSCLGSVIISRKEEMDFSLCHAGSQTMPRVRLTDWRDRHVLHKLPCLLSPLFCTSTSSLTPSAREIAAASRNPATVALRATEILLTFHRRRCAFNAAAAYKNNTETPD